MSSIFLAWNKIRRSLLVFLVVGGTLFQTSCSELATDLAIGALTSVTSTYITYSVYEWMGLNGGMGGMFGFGGF